MTAVGWEWESWEGDVAHAALRTWLASWRHMTGPDAVLPSMSFGAHLGREAVAAMVAGRSRSDASREFGGLGYGGLCACGSESTPIEPAAVL